MSKNYKKYSENIKKGNKGQAIFETITGDYIIAHRIDTSKDIGVDYLCEWVNKDKPTGLVFAVQVKNYPSKKAIKIGNEIRLNLLDIYKIEPNIYIEQRTQEYWNILGMPCFLFVVIPKDNSVDLFYKRYTPIVNGKATELKSPFYKVNDELIFLAFARDNIGGFARDLYIDQIRCNYNKGLIAYLNPRRIGLKQFPDTDRDVFFKDIFREYKASFKDTFEQLSIVLGREDKLKVIPSEAPPENND